jgi:hypothetical protein
MGDIGPIKRIIEVLPDHDPVCEPTREPPQQPYEVPIKPNKEPAR